jgi:hypothetical protein
MTVTSRHSGPWPDGDAAAFEHMERLSLEWDSNKGEDGTSGMAGASSLVESVENLGWRLDQMSWVRVSVKVEGIFPVPP